MASKKKGGRDDFDFDSDLNFEIPDFGGDNLEATKKDRKPIVTGVKSAASGFGKTFTSESRLRKTLTKSLPKEYEEPISTAFQIKDGARDLYNSTAGQTQEFVRESKRSIGRIVRNVKGSLPKKLEDRLLKFADSADSDSSGNLSKGEIEQGTITQAFTDIFAQTQLNQADRDKNADARQVMQDQIDQKRHKDMTTILGSIDQSLISMQTYQEKIGTNYLKKSLELQFRTYFVQNDMLQLQAKFFDQFKTDLQAITKNTGLPDYVKKAPKEALMELMRAKTFESLTNTIARRRNQWLSGVFKKAGDKAGNLVGNIRDFSSQILDAAEGMSSMAGSGLGPSNAEFVGDIAGGIAGGKFQDAIAKRIRAALVKNPKAVKFGNKLSMLNNGLPQWVGNQLDNGKYADKIPDWLKDILRPDAESSSLRLNREVDLERAKQWSDKNSRSLNIVIPELLSDIKHELYVIRTGDTTASPQSYDYEKGKFVDRKDRATQLKNTVVSKRSIDSTKYQLDSIFKEIDPDNKLDAEARKQLSESIYGANKRGVFFNKENMSGYRALGEGAHADHAGQLIKDYIDKDSTGGAERRLSKMFGRVGEYNGEVKDLIQELVDSGRHGELAEMGLIDLKTGRINLDAVRRLELGHGLPAGGPVMSTVPVAPAPAGGGGALTSSAMSKLRDAFMKKQRGFIGGGKPAGAPPTTIPGGPNELKDLSKMFREIITSLNKLAQSGDIDKRGAKTITAAIEKAGGKTELQEIRDILKRIEEKGMGGGVIMTPEMLQSYLKDKAGGFFGRAGQLGKSLGSKIAGGLWGSAKRTGSLAKKGWNWAMSGPSILDRLGAQKDKFDLFIGNEVEPRLNKAKMAAGRYIDETTGKVITKYEDIKGAVKDLDTGDIVLRAGELKEAILKNFETGKSILVRLTGWGKSAIKTSFDMIKKSADRIFNLSKSTYGMAWAGIKKAYERLTDGPMDVYLKDSYETPVLLKRIMEQGLYFDKVSLDPITKVSQIKGPVVDNEENVLITKDDLHNGLYDKTGKEIKTGFDRVTQFIGNSIKNTIGQYRKILGKAKDLGGKAMAWLKGLFGFDSPFTVFSKQTNDILSAIYNLLNDRMPGERSPDLDSMVGHHTSRTSSVNEAGRAVKEKATKAWSKAKEAHQQASDKVKDAYGKVRNADWDKAHQEVRNRLGRGKDALVDGIHDLYDLMKDRLPEAKKKVFGDSDGDGIRDGSIDDLRKKRDIAKQKLKDTAAAAAAGGKAGAQSIYGKIADLLKRNKKDEDEDDDHGDVNIDTGGGKKGKKPRGRLGRGWDKLKGKMTPKGTGKLARATRFGGRMLGGLGRGALAVGRFGVGAVLGGGLLSAETLVGGLSLVGSALGVAASAAGAILSSPITVPALLIAGTAAAGYFAYKWLTKPRPDPIETVRLVQYGWKPDNMKAYKDMKRLEQMVAPAVQFKGDKAEFDSKKLNIQEMMKIYGLTPTDQDQAKKFVTWFAGRFRPLYLNHRALIKTINSPKPLEDVDSNKPDLKNQYLDQCLFPGDHYSIPTSPYKDEAYLPAAQYTAEKQIKTAKDEISKEGAKKEDDKKKSNAPTGAGAAAAAAAAKTAQEKKALDSEEKKKASNTLGVPTAAPGQRDPDKAAALQRLIAATAGANSAPGGPGRAPNDPINSPAGPNGQSTAGNAKFDAGGLNIKQPGNGTGGDINSVPIPKGNGSWSALKDTIIAASKMAGVDPKLSAAITAVESGFDYSARPIDKKTGKLFSSAKGLNQFIDGTWNTMMNKYAKKYGIDPSTSAMDPRANALLGAEFLKENMAGLKQAVKRDLTATDVYIAHFMGLGGARKFLSADPNSSGASIFPDAAKANPWIYFKDPKTMQQPKTLGEIYNDFTQKLSKKLAASGYTDSDAASIGADPTKVKEDNARLQAATSGGDIPTNKGTPEASGKVTPGAPVASPKPTTPNTLDSNPNAGPVPNGYSSIKPTTAASMVASPKPSYDPSTSSAPAPVVSSSPAPSRDQFAQKQNVVNLGDSLEIAKQTRDESQKQTGFLQRIADGIDKLNSRFDKNMASTQPDTPAPPSERNNYGKTPAKMPEPSIAFRRAFANQ